MQEEERRRKNRTLERSQRQRWRLKVHLYEEKSDDACIGVVCEHDYVLPLKYEFIFKYA